MQIIEDILSFFSHRPALALLILVVIILIILWIIEDHMGPPNAKLFNPEL